MEALDSSGNLIKAGDLVSLKWTSGTQKIYMVQKIVNDPDPTRTEKRVLLVGKNFTISATRFALVQRLNQ